MIRPFNQSELTNSNSLKDVIIGIAVENEQLLSLLNLEYMIWDQKMGNGTIKNESSFRCSNQVYSNLIQHDYRSIPKGLDIRCIKVTPNDFMEGKFPSIIVSKILSSKLIQNFRVWSFISTNIENLENNEQSVESFVALPVLGSTQIQSKIEFYLRQSETLSYDGVIMPKKKIQQSFKYEYKDKTVTSINPKRELLRMRVVFDNYSQIFIEKKSQSLSSTIAYLGGLFRGISIIFMIIVWPFREILFYRKIINALFHVCLNFTELNSMMENYIDSSSDNSSSSDSGGEGKSEKVINKKKKEKTEQVKRMVFNRIVKKKFMKKKTVLEQKKILQKKKTLPKERKLKKMRVNYKDSRGILDLLSHRNDTEPLFKEDEDNFESSQLIKASFNIPRPFNESQGDYKPDKQSKFYHNSKKINNIESKYSNSEPQVQESIRQSKIDSEFSNDMRITVPHIQIQSPSFCFDNGYEKIEKNNSSSNRFQLEKNKNQLDSSKAYLDEEYNSRHPHDSGAQNSSDDSDAELKKNKKVN